MKIINRYQDALDIRQQLSILQTSGCHLLYRGHAFNHFKLVSTVGRKIPIYSNQLDSEKGCLKEFIDLVEMKGWNRYKVSDYNSMMFYMSIGRHLGLYCRLLDWSASLETALYFASFNDNYANADGTLWIMIYQGDVNSQNSKLNPFEVDKLCLIKEDYFIPSNESIIDQPLGIMRRFRQNGYFTITPTHLTHAPLDKIATKNIKFIPIIIKAEAKEDINNKVCIDNNFLYIEEKTRLENDIAKINAKYFE